MKSIITKQIMPQHISMSFAETIMLCNEAMLTHSQLQKKKTKKL